MNHSKLRSLTGAWLADQRLDQNATILAILFGSGSSADNLNCQMSFRTVRVLISAFWWSNVLRASRDITDMRLVFLSWFKTFTSIGSFVFEYQIIRWLSSKAQEICYIHGGSSTLLYNNIIGHKTEVKKKSRIFKTTGFFFTSTCPESSLFPDVEWEGEMARRMQNCNTRKV